MTITAWRIVNETRRDAAFDGDGARLFGGRFNSRGAPMVYTSTALSLAMLELLVHVDQARPLARHVAISVLLDESLLRFVDPPELPEDWKRPVTPSTTQRLGDLWIESNASVALAVPSVLLPERMFGVEHNILVNPRHKRFSSIEIGRPQPLPFDDRL